MDKNLINKISDNLKILARNVEQTSYIHKIEVEIKFPAIYRSFPPASLLPIIDDYNVNRDSKYLYIMKALEGTNMTECYHAFSTAKANEVNSRAYARINEPSTSTFYVGTSKSLGSRLKQHFGYASARVYSLQLAHWIKDIGGGLKLIVYRYPQGTDQKVLQAIEDGFWEEMSPMFGRQGAK